MFGVQSLHNKSQIEVNKGNTSSIKDMKYKTWLLNIWDLLFKKLLVKLSDGWNKEELESSVIGMCPFRVKCNFLKNCGTTNIYFMDWCNGLLGSTVMRDVQSKQMNKN